MTTETSNYEGTKHTTPPRAPRRRFHASAGKLQSAIRSGTPDAMQAAFTAFRGALARYRQTWPVAHISGHVPPCETNCTPAPD